MNPVLFLSIFTAFKEKKGKEKERRGKAKETKSFLFFFFFPSAGACALVAWMAAAEATSRLASKPLQSSIRRSHMLPVLRRTWVSGDA